MDDDVPESDLEKAAREGDVARLKELAHDSDFDRSSEEAAAALCAAAGHSHWEVVRYLVEDAGVDASSDASGGMALQIAAVAGQLESMKMLVAAGANIKSAQVGSRILLSSAATGQMDILRYAIDQGSDVAAYGGSAAWSAAKVSAWEAVQELVIRGANLEQDGLGVKLLSLAAVREQKTVLEQLVNKGVVIKSRSGELALASLASTQEWDVCADAIGYLVANGVNTKSESGIKALVTAAVCGDIEMVRCLAESGVDLAAESVGEALARAGELGGPGSTEAVVSYLTGMGVPMPKSPELVLDDDF